MHNAHWKVIEQNLKHSPVLKEHLNDEISRIELGNFFLKGLRDYFIA